MSQENPMPMISLQREALQVLEYVIKNVQGILDFINKLKSQIL